MTECPECGASVSDPEKHSLWHRRLKDEMLSYGELVHSLSVRLYDLEVRSG